MQDLKQNYFELFKLPVSYDVDIASLTEKYRDMQVAAHPDRVAAESEEVKMRAVQFSSFINEAYDSLKDPLKRLAYILSLNGLDVEKVSQSDLGMDLLMEQMQLRESLEELPKDESAIEDLESIKKDVQEKQKQRLDDISASLGEQDFESAKKLYHEMQFLYKLLAEIEAGEEARLGY